MGESVKVDCEAYFYSNVGSKVTSMEVHPFHPWLLTAHKNSTVVVWNYELKKVLYDINLQTLDDDDITALGGANNNLNNSGASVTSSGSGSGASGPIAMGAVGSIGSSSGTGLNTIVSGNNTPTSSHVGGATNSPGGGGTTSRDSSLSNMGGVMTASQSNTTGVSSPSSSTVGGSSGSSLQVASGSINNSLGSQSSDPATKQQTLEKKFGQIKAIKFYDKHTKKLKALTENTYRSFLYSSSPTSSSPGNNDAAMKKQGSLIGGLDLSKKTNNKKTEEEDKMKSSTTSGNNNISGGTSSSNLNNEDEPTTIIILTEHRVLFFDYETLSFSEIRLSLFEHKPPLSVDFFSDLPLLCFGGSDGQIRVWDFDKKEFYVPERSGGSKSTTKGWLSGAHKSAVTNILCVPPIASSSQILSASSSSSSSSSSSGKSNSGVRQVLSGGADGTLCMWDLASEKDHNYTLQKKLFTSELIGFTFNFLDGTLLIAESKPTQDRIIYGWNINANHEVYKVNLKKKMNKQAIGIITSLEPFPHPRFGSSSLVITFKADTKVYTVSSDSAVRELCDVASKIPSSLLSYSVKKQIKLYGTLVHPLQPHLLFCNTNVGLVSFQVDRTWLPTVAYNITLDNKFALYTIVNDKITIQELDYERGNLVKRSAVKGLENSQTGIKLMGSPTGKYLAVFSEESHFFQILDIASGCKILDQASAYSFVWAGGQDRYAYLESTLFSEQSGKGKEESKRRGLMGAMLGKGSGSSGNSSIGSKKAQANQAIQHGRLRIKEIEHDQMKEVVGDLSWFLQALNARVIRLFGGALLGILLDPSTPSNSSQTATNSITSASNVSSDTTARRRPTSTRDQPPTVGSSSPLSMSSKEGTNSPTTASGMGAVNNMTGIQGIGEIQQLEQLPFLQFYSWNTQDAVGSQLAPPLEVVSSDGDIRCVGLIYATHVCIFSISPTIKLISKINKSVLSAFWLRGTFFYATPTTIEAVFPQAEDEESMVIACGISISTLPLRPIGSIAFVSAFRDRILVVDCMNTMHWIWLGDPLLQFYLLVGSKNISEALLRARKLKSKKQSDKLARYLVQMGFPREATQLPSISTQMKLRIAIKYNIFEVATEMLCSLLDKATPLLGSNDSSSLSLINFESNSSKKVGRLPLEKLKQWNIASVASSLASPHTPHTAHTPHIQDSPHYLNPTTTFALNMPATEQLSTKSSHLPSSPQKFISDVNMSASTKSATSDDSPEWTLKRLVECAKTVANALLAASQLTFAETLLRKLVIFDSEMYLHLAGIYETRGEKEKVKRLYDELCSRGHHDSAKCVALFLDDSLLASSLQHSIHCSESITFTTSNVSVSSSSSSNNNPSSTRKWNELFQQQKYGQYSFSENHITFKSFSPSPSTVITPSPSPL
eukprot:TRINITY_DN1700_c1_g3_i1.p1 TRINITY_DN1700_c1_g3~~TRINITY_DN1700_c1_g3_i1.p1  ORF type:complete len:1438 (+),score=318.79 TRINITY_DN1700_c1_g3_i1:131-4315(+)